MTPTDLDTFTQALTPAASSLTLLFLALLGLALLVVGCKVWLG